MVRACRRDSGNSRLVGMRMSGAICGRTLPCGSWQSTQDIAPWAVCARRAAGNWPSCPVWHAAHCALIAGAVARHQAVGPFLCTEWQPTQLTLFLAWRSAGARYVGGTVEMATQADAVGLRRPPACRVADQCGIGRFGVLAGRAVAGFAGFAFPAALLFGLPPRNADSSGRR